ncbi:PIN domain-containing protein [Chitinophaga defluvii]|uniref:PIN domain-containing protein n=1 Tax=Chitinophaga defluvii TaxID=3163343 RepID=A0ABV2T206_9BACT
MCIVVDTNTLASVFSRNSDNHEEFEPVFTWLMEGRGKVVYGGSKYVKELKENYLRLFVTLRSIHKAVYISNAKVDALEANVSQQIEHPDFDDQHLVGLLIASGCKLVCSLDKRAYPYFKHSLFFSNTSSRPKIYRSRNNKALLSDANIAEICKPCISTTNAQREKLTAAQKIFEKK